MPYVGKEREAALIADPSVANTVGDYNTLYTMAYLKAFLRDPHYSMIHAIREASFVPGRLPEVKEVETSIAPVADISARTTARELAFIEFYQRIGGPYENLMRNKNGDLQLYKEAQAKLFEIAKDLALKQKALGGLTNDK